MTDKPPKPQPDDTDSEADIQRRFEETLGRLVNTPHKPHAPSKQSERRKGGRREA